MRVARAGGAALVGLILAMTPGCREQASGPAKPAEAAEAAEAATADEEGAAPEVEVEAKARAALGPFKKRLMGALKAGLADSPVMAIDACNHEAPKIAAEAAVPGVTVGRATAKTRNPANAPRDWMKAVLDELSAAEADPEASRTVDLGGGRYGYAEPIYMKGLCLTCHGKAVPPEVEAELARRYPKDTARGYEEGDFRGIFWAEVTVGAAP